ncbi:hypothetical protein [Sphingopyxis sp.]|uniref:hypothetical protein n=1 Tax=Sphingopyxis sp. TaxID=1908224 RepID=UPI003BA9AC61
MRPLIVAVAAVGLAGSAAAQPAQDVADARCILAFKMFVTRVGDKLTESDKSIFDSFATYFVGKIRARSPAIDIATLIPPPIVRAVQDGLKEEVTRCNAETAIISTSLAQTSKALTATIEANKNGN